MNERDLIARAGVRLLAENTSGQMPDPLGKECFPEEHFASIEPNEMSDPNIATGCIGFLGYQGIERATIDYEGDNPDERINAPELG